MRFRLRTKLTLLMIALIGGNSLLIFLYAPSIVRKASLQEAIENADSLSGMAAFNVSSAVLFDDRRGGYEALNGLRELDDFAFVNVRSMNGQPVLSIVNPRAKAKVYEAVSPVMHEGRQIGTVTLGISLHDVYDGIGGATKAVGFFTIALFMIGIVVSFAFAALITRPLQRIADTAEQVRQGRLNTRADVRTHDEVGTLATTFNMMLDGLANVHGELETVNQQLTVDADKHRKVAEDRERLAHEMSLVLDSTGDGIIATDANAICVLVNRAAKELLGYDSTQIIGRALRDVLHPVHRSDDETMDQVMAGETLSTRPATVARFDRAPLSVELSSSPIVDRDVQVGIVLSFRDVTERESLRQRLDAARRLTTLGRIAASIAHEINNVLMGIQPFAEIIQRDAASASQIARSCQSILQSVKRGRRVTSEVLQFARPSEPAFAVTDAVGWIRLFCGDQQATLRGTHQLELHIPDEPVAISVDREQLEQVFANLISNARDAMPRGGVIEVRARADGPNMIHFEVADRGCGMSAETVERIFEPFFTTKGPRGTGLGLAIAQQIILQHGGELRVDSTIGVGTTFHIFIPSIAATVATVVHMVPVAPSQPLSRQCIVIVEDDSTVASGIAAILQNAGATVEVLSEGRALVPTVRRLRPDGVVLDISLPDIDGVEAYRELQRDFPTLPVVFSTGHADKSHLGDILMLPHVRFLQKPYAGETLIAELSEVCEVDRSASVAS